MWCASISILCVPLSTVRHRVQWLWNVSHLVYSVLKSIPYRKQCLACWSWYVWTCALVLLLLISLFYFYLITQHFWYCLFQVGVKNTVTLYPFMLHSLSMSTFSSVIGPFGGFFASGFKRAFKIKVGIMMNILLVFNFLNRHEVKKLFLSRTLGMWFLAMVVSWIVLIASILWLHLSMSTSQASYTTSHHRNCCKWFVSQNLHNSFPYVFMCFNFLVFFLGSFSEAWAATQPILYTQRKSWKTGYCAATLNFIPLLFVSFLPCFNHPGTYSSPIIPGLNLSIQTWALFLQMIKLHHSLVVSYISLNNPFKFLYGQIIVHWSLIFSPIYTILMLITWCAGGRN